MKKYLPLISFLLLLAILIPVGMVFAGTYVNYVTIRVFNNSTSVYSNVAILIPMNISSFVPSYLNSTGTNSEVYEGGYTTYSQATNYLSFFVPSFSAGQVRTYDYRLQVTPGQGGFPLAAGTGGYITTADGATLEPGASAFQVTWIGFYDSTKTGVILGKLGEYGLISTTAGTVKGFSGNGTVVTQNMTPNAVGNYNDWSVVGNSTAWGSLGDSSDGSYVSMAAGSGVYRTSVNVSSPSSLEGSYISSVQVFFRAQDYTGDDTVTPFLRLGGVNAEGSPVDTGTSWGNYTQTISRPGGGSWVRTDFESLEGGVRYDPGASGITLIVSRLYIIINCTSPNTGVSATVGSGVVNLTAVRSGAVVTLYVNSVSQGTGTAATPTVLASSVISSENGPAAYTTLSKITVGTDKLWYQPISTITPTAVTDRSGNANPGVITWGTNPTGFVVTPGNIQSLLAYTVPGSNTTNIPIWTPPPTNTTGLVPEDPTKDVSGLFAYDLMKRFADAIGWSVQFSYAFWMFGVAILFGFGGMIATGSTWGFVMGVAVMGGTALGTGILPWWLIVLAVALVIFIIFLWGKL